MGLALLAIIWLITFVSSYFFAAKTWWLPHGASASAPWIDHQFALTYLLMGIVFVAAQGALGLFVWQYRDRGVAARKSDYSHGNIKLELLWTVLTAVLFVGLNLMGSPIWAAERFAPAKPGSIPVEVTGMQFAWYFRYAGADGKFGATDPKLMDPSAGSEAAMTNMNVRNSESPRIAYILIEASANTLETAGSLLQHPTDNPRVVVAVAQVVVQRGEAMRLTGLLHFVELRDIEVVIAHGAPIVSRRIHRKAGRERAIHPDDQRVLARPAIPRLQLAA